MPDVLSIAISRISYDAFARELDVIFTSSRHYRYFDVSAATYRQLVDAPSKEAFFKASIHGRHSSEEIVERRRHVDAMRHFSRA